VKLPLAAAVTLARGLELNPMLERPPITVGEVRAASLWWSFRSTKAKRELGYKPSHHEDTLQTTIDWYREREPARLREPGTRQPIPLRMVGFGVKQTTSLAGWLD
jgi:dihydroflavonol-4-reductase